ncbi:LOW QUALITY PROTEIN: MRG-domain-containing protein [Jimgerdemannia flammicorona]|uniref:Chromatin modification-related protein EAF3 n=1 Tax=Jimgerdemannia flammicorona TaxID=994334 RepID=A0A433PVR5_9FUNG|nr:LOW QUALITY PROTEIN: MRG-domain-containing protein [Jimgerdemannia flammicorona]
MAGNKELTFKDDERILCFHGPLLYEAKVLKGEYWDSKDAEGEEGPHYFVHYKGWKQTWDEWVPESRALKWTEANLAKQQQLKELHSQKKKPAKPATTSTLASDRASHGEGSGGGGAGGGSGDQRGRKRASQSMDKAYVHRLQEEDYMKRPEVKVPIPDSLKAQLVDDWENVTKNQQLVPVPRNPNVVQILELYREAKKDKKRESRTDDILSEIVQGIKLYFDKALGNMLLYRFERHQYVEVRKKNADKDMSEIYGAEHLLRLFVQMPSLIAHTNMDHDSVNLLREHLVEFLNTQHLLGLLGPSIRPKPRPFLLTRPPFTSPRRHQVHAEASQTAFPWRVRKRQSRLRVHD